MGKLRQTALILGEGPTEFFYFKSLCDVFKRLTIKPDYPKHTNLKELESKIEEGEDSRWDRYLGMTAVMTQVPMTLVLFRHTNTTKKRALRLAFLCERVR